MNELVDPNADPKLVESVVFKRINKILEKKTEPSWTDNIKSFYSNYIHPNLFTIIFIVFGVTCLYFRYKHVKAEKKKSDAKAKRKRKEKQQQKYMSQILSMYNLQQDQLVEVIKERDNLLKYANRRSSKPSFNQPTKINSRAQYPNQMDIDDPDNPLTSKNNPTNIPVAMGSGNNLIAMYKTDFT